MMMMKNVEFNYVNLLTPKAFGDQDPKFSVMIVFPEDHPQVDELKQELNDAKKEKWGEKAAKMPNLKTPLKEGPYITNNGDEVVPDGMYYMTISTAFRTDRPNNGQPLILDAKRNSISDPGDIYSGCKGHVIFNVRAYDLPTSKGVTAYVAGVQVIEKGENKSGGITVDAFDEEDGYTREDLFAEAA
jgi:hypothetical protein